MGDGRGGSVGCVMMNKERGRTPTPGRHGWGGGGGGGGGGGLMLVFDGGKGGDARISTRLRFFPGCQTI